MPTIFLKCIVALFITSLFTACVEEALPATKCHENPSVIQWQLLLDTDCEKLSSYGLFNADGQPRTRGFNYDLNIALYSDYSYKYRTLFIPEGKKISLAADGNTLNFPVGSVLVKTFAMRDETLKEINANNREKRIETRLLIKGDIDWRALIYVWNETQTEALYSEGDILILTRLRHRQASLDFSYLIPAKRYCFDCHQNNMQIQALGLKMKNLNRSFNGQNQLEQLITENLLEMLPKPSAQLPALKTFSNFEPLDFAQLNDIEVQELATEYLAINCGSCHSPIQKNQLVGGMASPFTNLNFTSHSTSNGQSVLESYGACKEMNIIAHLFGTTNQYVIVPGAPQKSALIERMLVPPGFTRMPAVGTNLPHQEGIALLSEWIKRIPLSGCL